MSDVPRDPLAPPHDQGPAAQEPRPERVIFRPPWGHTASDAPSLPAAAPLVTDLQFLDKAPVAQAAPVAAQGGAAAPGPLSSLPESAELHSTELQGTELQGAEIGAAEQLVTVPPDVVAAQPPSRAAPPLTPAQGGWAAIILLLMQNLLGGLAEYWHLSLALPLLVAFGLTILGYFALLPYPMRLLRADSRWQTKPRIGLTLGAFVLGFVASRGILIFGVSLWPAALSAMPQFLSKSSDWLPLFVAAGLCIPIAEEIAFRGLLLRGLERARGPLFGALLTSGLFALAHGSPLQVIAILPLAWVMARAVQYSGSLWTSVGIHMLNNSLAVLTGALLGDKLASSPLGGMALDVSQRVPLTLGLAGLLVGLGALAIATAWLKPRYAAPQAKSPPRVWTVSTLLLLAFVVFAVGLVSWRLLGSGVQRVDF